MFCKLDLRLLTLVVAPVHHIKGLEVASSAYHKVLEENRLLYNQVQDLKGGLISSDLLTYGYLFLL